ncbi:uncharacterized [Tachysurus ichikawai]
MCAPSSICAPAPPVTSYHKISSAQETDIRSRQSTALLAFTWEVLLVCLAQGELETGNLLSLPVARTGHSRGCWKVVSVLYPEDVESWLDAASPCPCDTQTSDRRSLRIEGFSELYDAHRLDTWVHNGSPGLNWI